MVKNARKPGRPQAEYPEIIEVLKERGVRMNVFQIYEELKKRGIRRNKWSKYAKDRASLKPLSHKTIKEHLESYLEEGKVVRVNKNNEWMEEAPGKRKRCYYVHPSYTAGGRRIRQIQLEYLKRENEVLAAEYDFLCNTVKLFLEENPDAKGKWEEARKKMLLRKNEIA